MPRPNSIQMDKPRLIRPIGFNELQRLKLTSQMKVAKVHHQGEERILFVLPDYGVAWVARGVDELRQMRAALDELIDETTRI